jgi:GYF domain 2
VGADGITDWDSLGWYYRKDSKDIGPVSTEELVRLLAARAIHPSTEVWKSQPGRYYTTDAMAAANGPRGAG